MLDIAPDPPSRHHHPANVATTETITVTWRARHTNGPWTAACDTRQAALDALETTPWT
jgi:hypothetical protein